LGKYYSIQPDISYYRYMIKRGIPIRGEMLPVPNVIHTRKEGKNLYSEDADVCLMCDKQDCSGSAQCYAKRRDEITAGARLSGKDGKEVVE